MILVINEWLLEDLLGNNGNVSRKESFDFLVRLAARDDQIAVMYGTSWVRKAYKLMRENDPRSRVVSKFLHLAILRDSTKCLLLDVGAGNAPANILGQMPLDDAYLIQTYFAANAGLLVTGDRRLMKVLETLEGRPVICAHKDDFLQSY